MRSTYDALLLVSFGGPERHEDVMPFLENVLRGKNVPRERMLEVAEHYYHFDGVSPINQQNRELIGLLEQEFREQGPSMPVYWGNRNWHPLLVDTLTQMADDGVRRALAFVTSAYSSYSGCRQYREDIERARAAVGKRAPVVDKLRVFFNHPNFIEALADRVDCALGSVPAERRATTQLVFTAHSIPLSMAQGCQYEAQLRETCRLVIERVGDHRHALVYQSRSGPPTQPWLEPDICDYLRDTAASGQTTDVVLIPVGFLSDHMEVLYDLDYEALHLCGELGLHAVRAQTPGNHPQVIRMIRELVLERTARGEKRAVGRLAAGRDVCPGDCCPSGRASAGGRAAHA